MWGVFQMSYCWQLSSLTETDRASDSRCSRWAPDLINWRVCCPQRCFQSKGALPVSSLPSQGTRSCLALRYSWIVVYSALVLSNCVSPTAQGQPGLRSRTSAAAALAALWPAAGSEHWLISAYLLHPTARLLFQIAQCICASTHSCLRYSLHLLALSRVPTVPPASYRFA